MKKNNIVPWTIVSLLARLAACKFYEGDCFLENQLFGFDAGLYAEPLVSDASALFTDKLMEEDTKPVAFKICFADAEIKAIQVRVANSKYKDWLNVIGDDEYASKNDCEVYKPTEDSDELIAIYINIGYTEKRGVNYFNLVFAPNYDNQDTELEVSFEVGSPETDMDFINLAFSQQSSFIGFQGVTSDFGLPLNKLGVVTFTCAEVIVNESALTIRTDGITASGGGSLISAKELEK